jgi:hypothetical protein
VSREYSEDQPMGEWLKEEEEEEEGPGKGEAQNTDS